MQTQQSVAAASRRSTADFPEADLRIRIQAEFAEMPGLKLTLPQASRLFNVDAARCERALKTLVAIGLLSVAHGAFVRAGSGRHGA